MIDKNYCMSSYLAFRYIEDDNMDFFSGLHHENIKPVDPKQQILVHSAKEIDKSLNEQISNYKNKRVGILLSGGMDSAIIASYLTGSDAYTFRFLGGDYQKEELARAEYYANYYGLNLHYVDITWNTVESYLPVVLKEKAAPVHSIEPQLYQAAIQAKNDGIDVLMIGESSDLVFGGMDGLLAKDWDFSEFVDRYIFTNPIDVLTEPTSMLYLFERYRLPNNKINYLKFMDEVFAIESSSSYYNAFSAARLDYFDPYARLKMADKLDLHRIRNGEPKYLIRELMSWKYPEITVPNKVPMPRPVDEYFKSWDGPSRNEFRKDIDINKYTGNQKWQMYCLEQFLNLYD